jgi:hypothetical protein
VDASTLLLGAASGAVTGLFRLGAIPSVAAMMGTNTASPNSQMVQALLASTLMGQQAGAIGQKYEIKCTDAE